MHITWVATLHEERFEKYKHIRDSVLNLFDDI